MYVFGTAFGTKACCGIQNLHTCELFLEGLSLPDGEVWSLLQHACGTQPTPMQLKTWVPRQKPVFSNTTIQRLLFEHPVATCEGKILEFERWGKLFQCYNTVSVQGKCIGRYKWNQNLGLLPLQSNLNFNVLSMLQHCTLNASLKIKQYQREWGLT